MVKSLKDTSSTSISSQNWKHCFCHQPNSQCFQTLDNNTSNNNNAQMAPSMRPANRPNRSYPAFGQEPHLAPRCTVLTSTTSNTRWHRLNGRSNWGNGFPSPLSKARAQEQLWVLVPLPTVTVFCSSFPYLGRGLYISWISPSRSGPEHTYLLVSRQIHSPSSSLLLQALLGPYSGLYRPGETSHQEGISKFN